MKKLVVSAVVGVILANTILPVSSGALLTKSADFSKAATYGLNTATYTAEKKSGKEAVEKLLTFDIIWDVMGKGEEFFLNGDPDAFPKFKDDVLKVKLVLDKVAEVSAKIGAGEYDDALIGSVDGMVGIVNHPVVNLLWESVKLTYESHKLVKSSKAALQIETLYGVVNNDRRLIGTSSGDSPPLIPVNTETVTYFYNKYLITDASTRALVKAYVKTKLGEDFPEISTSSSAWAYLTGTSEAVQDEHELQQLQEFENNSRRWIKELLQDLNIQVQKQWAEARFRQESEKFKMFTAQFGKAIGNMDEVIAYYSKVKRLEKQKEQFPIKLEEYKRAKAQLESKYSTANYEEKLGIRGGLFNIAQDCNVYAVNSMIINEPALQGQFETLQIECLQLVNKIDKEIEANKEQITAEIHSPYENASQTYKDYQASFLAKFEPALNIIEEAMSGYEEPPTEDIKSFLAANNLDEAQKTFNNWRIEQDKIFENAELEFNQAFLECEESKPGIYSAPHIKWLESEGKKIDEQAIKIATGQRDATWELAKKKTLEAQEAIIKINTLKYSNDKNLITAMIGHFVSEMNRVKNAVDQNLKAYTDFLQKLFHPNDPGRYLVPNFDPDSINIKWKPQVAYNAENANKYLSENRYTYMAKINDDGVVINNVGTFISIKKSEIMAPLSVHNVCIASLNNIEGELYRINALKNDWKKFPKLDNETLAFYNDFAKYNSLDEQRKTEWEADLKARTATVAREVSSNPNWGRIDQYQTTINKMTQLMDSIDTGIIKGQAKQYLEAVNTDLINRENDYDYLDKLEKQWESWYQYLLSNNRLTIDRESGRYIFDAGFAKTEGVNYAKIYKPYAHYALENELKSNEMLKKAKDDLIKLQVYKFIQLNMSNTKILLDNLFTAKGFEPAPEENFLITKFVVWKSDLGKAEKIISAINIKNDASYKSDLLEISKLLPFTVSFPELTKKNENDYASKWQNKYGKFDDKFTTYNLEGFELGQKFIKLREQVQELIAAKGRLSQQESYAETLGAESAIRLVKYQEEFNKIKMTLGVLEDKKQVNELYQTYSDLRTRYSNDAIAKQQAFSDDLNQYEATFISVTKKLELVEQQDIQRISDFYISFKEAYESKSDYGVLNLISNEWDSGDGTTLSDLEDNFRNMFSVFDSITYSVSNLTVLKQPDGNYVSNYDVTITGKIYDNDITHVEKSNVNELVRIENNKPKIYKTLQGRFWYIE